MLLLYGCSIGQMYFACVLRLMFSELVTVPDSLLPLSGRKISLNLTVLRACKGA